MGNIHFTTLNDGMIKICSQGTILLQRFTTVLAIWTGMVLGITVWMMIRYDMK